MKVLQINATLGYTSTGIIAKDIGDLINAEGGESFYAYQTCPNPPQNSKRIGNLLDWKIHALLCRISGKQAYFSSGATKRFLKYISSIKPDVVHLHNLHSNYINLNLLLQFLKSKKIYTVITMHDCWYFTGKCFHYIDIGCEKFKKGCGNCPKKNAPPESWLFDCSKKVLTDKYENLSQIPRVTLVGCSKWICNEITKSVLKDLKVRHIYNGVDVNLFKPYDNSELREKYNLDASCNVIMGMANKWLLKSNKELFERTLGLLNENTRLMLVGCNKHQIDYLKRSSEYIIPVEFIKGREELARHYSLGNVFVNPTHADTLPTVNMESVCCGTPVITYDSCGSPELVLDGCGKVVSEYDVSSMISAIGEKQSGIDEQTLREARTQFDKNNCYKKYLQIYREALSEEGVSRC